MTLEDLLDELRIEPGRYAGVRDGAVIRCLALRDLGRATAGSDSDLQQAADGFRRDRGLHDSHDIERWLADNDLTVAQFAALIREENAVRYAVAGAEPELGIHLRSQLRADGLYPWLASRARHKRLSLTATGLDNPGGIPDDPSCEELLGWYFSRLETSVPDDLSAHWQSLGFSQESDFLRAILREYRFAILVGRHSAGGHVIKEEGHEPGYQGDGRLQSAAATPHPAA